MFRATSICAVNRYLEGLSEVANLLGEAEGSCRGTGIKGRVGAVFGPPVLPFQQSQLPHVPASGTSLQALWGTSPSLALLSAHLPQNSERKGIRQFRKESLNPPGVQGYSDENELDASVREAKEQILVSNPQLVMYDTQARHDPTGRVRVHSPARLSTEMNMAIRDAAVKAFIVSPQPLLHLSATEHPRMGLWS